MSKSVILCMKKINDYLSFLFENEFFIGVRIIPHTNRLYEITENHIFSKLQQSYIVLQCCESVIFVHYYFGNLRKFLFENIKYWAFNINENLLLTLAIWVPCSSVSKLNLPNANMTLSAVKIVESVSMQWPAAIIWKYN